MPTGGNNFKLDGPGRQIVEALFGDQAEEMTRAGGRLRSGNIPACKIAATGIKHFALLNEEFHGLPDFFPGGMTVNVMHLIDVNVVGFEPAQAVLAGLTNMISGQMAIVRAGAHGLIDFRCQDNALTSPALLKPASNDFLGKP